MSDLPLNENGRFKRDRTQTRRFWRSETSSRCRAFALTESISILVSRLWGYHIRSELLFMQLVSFGAPAQQYSPVFRFFLGPSIFKTWAIPLKSYSVLLVPCHPAHLNTSQIPQIPVWPRRECRTKRHDYRIFKVL